MPKRKVEYTIDNGETAVMVRVSEGEVTEADVALKSGEIAVDYSDSFGIVTLSLADAHKASNDLERALLVSATIELVN